MRIIGIIPSRYGSTRFPGKPLADIDGQSMIQRVYLQAKKAGLLSDVIVATDDQRIFDHVLSFGGKVVMTSVDHLNGTSRCLEVLQSLTFQPDEVPVSGVVNIQGDEPFLDPEQIDQVAELLPWSETQVATLVKKIEDASELFNPNVVKAVFTKEKWASYFSRQAIPFIRDTEPEAWLKAHNFYKHIGIYGYRAGILSDLVDLPVSPLEKAESLEQLRWLENGFRIRVGITTKQAIAIDTPEDLSKLTNSL